MQEAQVSSEKGSHAPPSKPSGIDETEMDSPLPAAHDINDSGLLPADTPETQENAKAINIAVTYFFMRYLQTNDLKDILTPVLKKIQ